MKGCPITVFVSLLIVFIIAGCTEKNFVSVPDSYNDQGRELIYASERVEGEDYCGSFLKFTPNLDFQAAIDNAIEKGQEKFGEEYVALADIIAWYEVTNYIVYSTYCAKVTGWPARFASDMSNSFTFKTEDLPKIYDGKPVYYHSSTGIKNNLDNFEYTVENIEENIIGE
jgi:hypothetical protein